jgi:hypothetical protein
MTRGRIAHLPDEALTPAQLHNRRQARKRARPVGAPRATTIAVNRLPLAELERLRVLHPIDGVPERPATRGECIGGERPCVFVSCRWNLYLDVSQKTGSIKLNYPHLEPDEMTESCVLDLAARGGMTLEEVGACTNMTRERVRQIENAAVAKIANDDEAVALAIGALSR